MARRLNIRRALMPVPSVPPLVQARSEDPVSLADVLISEFISSIVRDERSGDLIVESGATARKIMFDRGSVGFASSNVDELRFGNLLLASGRITKAQLHLVLDVVKRDHCRIGEAMTATGILSRDEVAAGLARQILGIATSVYALREGTYRFDEHECRIPPELRIRVSSYRIQLEGIRQIPELHLIEETLASMEQYVKVAERAPFLFEEVELQPIELQVMEIARRVVSMKDILNEIADERPLVLRGIYGLLCSGVLQRTEPESERKPTPATAPEAETQRVAAQTAFVEGDPDFVPVPEPATTASPSSAVERDAPAEGRPPKDSGSNGASANKDEIARLFNEIKIRNMVEDRAGVASMLRKVVALAPDNAKYAAMLAKAVARLPKRAKDAEPYFRRALALDPQNAELHYEFGRYYQDLGMPSRALAELKMALRLDPGLSKARSAVVELKQTGESLVSKSLKKLFS